MIHISKLTHSLEASNLPEVDDSLRDATAKATVNLFEDIESKAALLDRIEQTFSTNRWDVEFAIYYGEIGQEVLPDQDWATYWNVLHMRDATLAEPIVQLMSQLKKSRSYAYGISTLIRLFPDVATDAAHRNCFKLGIISLGYDEAPSIVERRLRIGYLEQVIYDFARQLLDAKRPKVAMSILLQLPQEARTCRRVSELRKSIMTAMLHAQKSGPKPKISVRRSEVIPALVKHAEKLTRPVDFNKGVGSIVFFTGQLGAGGAERQMSRLSSELHHRQLNGLSVCEYRLNGPIHVCLRNTDPHRRGDFFLPALESAGLEPTLIDPMAVPDVSSLSGLSSEVLALLPMLRKGMRETTLKLIPYFQKTKPDVAYLWQDGGAMAAGLAALLTGTPRVVVSFRGLSPAHRPERLREEMPLLFREMIKLPQVSYSANSNAIARDYETWLDLPQGTISVVPNAVQDIKVSGDDEDQAFWTEMKKRSPEATRTVIGLFRYEPNKRPETWIKSAVQIVRRDPTVRFLIVGGGVKFAQCEQLVRDLDLSDRIFLAGTRKNVGFYLSRSDLMLHLAETEGLPNALIEAQICGVPVLATPAGGTGEVVIDGVTGTLLPSAETVSVEGIADAVRSLLSDCEKMDRFAVAALKLSHPRFNLNSVLANTMDLLVGDAATKGSDISKQEVAIVAV